MYEDFSDDPARQDRGVVTATFTYPVSQGFFVSVDAVHATKPEFCGDVDDELSARAGLVYKVITNARFPAL
jgi:aspartyl aminopeptidase